MARKLLIETLPVTFEIVEQASQNNRGRLKVRGVFGVPDEPTGNGNVYSEAVMDREIEKLNALIEDAAGWSEADHPGDGKSTIKNTAARFTKKIEKVTLDQLRKTAPALCLRFKDDSGTKKVYTGEAMILRTEPGGKNLQEMIETGGRVDVSQRGWGSTLSEKWDGSGKWKGQEVNLVGDDYSLRTFDFVIGGATRGATVELSEQLNFEKAWNGIVSRTHKMEVINLIETSPCGDCSNKKKGGIQPMDVVEKFAKQIVENLFSGSPSIPHAKINDSLEEILASNKDLVLISEEDQAEVTRLLDEAKKADSGDGKSLFGAGFVLGRLIEKKTGKPVKTLKEHQEPQYLTEDTQDRFRVLTELLLSKKTKEKGGPLTEQEANEVGKYIKEHSFEGRKRTLLEVIRASYPDAKITVGFNDRVFFQSGQEFFMAGYLIEDGKVKLSGIEEVELAFVPSGTLEPRHKGLFSTLQEQQGGVSDLDLRVAGLKKPPKIAASPVDLKLLTEDQKKNRRVAGLPIDE